MFWQQLGDGERLAELCRAAAHIQELPSASLLGFCFKSPVLVGANKLPILPH